jgi:hypothetical protein
MARRPSADESGNTCWEFVIKPQEAPLAGLESERDNKRRC